MSTLLTEHIRHVGGEWWHLVPPPRKFRHKHKPTTICPTVEGYEVHRCACGALAYSDIPGWREAANPRFRSWLA